MESLMASALARIPKNKVIKRGGKAAIYTRVSSLEQRNNNSSLETQDTMCRQFAQREQIPIKITFGGVHDSAKTDGRVEFKRMLNYVKKDKDISFIIVANFDRFSRTGAAAAKLSEDLAKEGIILRSVSQDIDTSTTYGRFQENMLHLMNNLDNQNKSVRTKLHTREVMLKGYWPYATPLGYENLHRKEKACNHEYVITDEGKELKKAFILKASGQYSNKEIVEKLNARGVRLTEKNFRLLISNVFYVGYVTGKLLDGQLVLGKHPPLIDMPTFLKANNMLNLAPTVGIAKVFRHDEVPLKVFAKDEVSGMPFTGYKTKGNWYYKTKKSTQPVNVKAEKLNGLFSNLLAEFEYDKTLKTALKKELLSQIKQQLSGSAENEKLLKKKITEKEKQITAVEEKFIMGDISKETYDKFILKYKAELQVLKQEFPQNEYSSSNLEKAVEKCLSIAQDLSQTWITANYEAKQKLQHLVFPEGI
ncbi:recombinase family protein, partial [Parasediminibacterium paludis]